MHIRLPLQPRSVSSTDRRGLSLRASEPVFTNVGARSAGILRQEMLMKAIAIATALGALVLGLAAPPAHARTCFRETVTGPAVHALTRGCTVVAHHASRAPRRIVRTTTRVTTDDYITTSVPSRTWSRYYSARVPRHRMAGYVTSYYPRSRYWYGASYQHGASYQPAYAAPMVRPARGGAIAIITGARLFLPGRPAPVATPPTTAEAVVLRIIQGSAGDTKPPF